MLALALHEELNVTGTLTFAVVGAVKHAFALVAGCTSLCLEQEEKSKINRDREIRDFLSIVIKMVCGRLKVA